MFHQKPHIIFVLISTLSSMLSTNFAFSADEESNNEEIFKTRESTLTDCAMITLGYLEPTFSNVGRLSIVYSLPFLGKITYNIGSVVLLDRDQDTNVRTCLSAAHCFEESQECSYKMKKIHYYIDILIRKHYEVTFESDDVPEYSCTVTHCSAP